MGPSRQCCTSTNVGGVWRQNCVSTGILVRLMLSAIFTGAKDQEINIPRVITTRDRFSP